MLRFLTLVASCCATLILAAHPAAAQWFGRNNCDCGGTSAAAYMSAPTISASSAVCAPVVQQAAVCPPVVQPTAVIQQSACVQPVMQTVYRQVPVVEMRAAKQVVKKPVVETKYVDQAVTEYHPVTETRMVEVPTTSYQDVADCQTVVRNMGYYRTRYDANLKMTPCQYDNRPGLMGWMNRTGQELTTAFTPDYRTTREYVPQTIVQNVPVTRRVAVQSTRQVAYNVTNMVAVQSTRKVAVAETKWVDDEITVMKPTTVVKTMAVGSQITYQPLGNTATAVRPQPEATIKAQGSTPARTADPFPSNTDPTKVKPNTRSALDPLPKRDSLVPTALPQLSMDDISLRPLPPATSAAPQLAEKAPFALPTAARAGGWTARSTKVTDMSVADIDRK